MCILPHILPASFPSFQWHESVFPMPWLAAVTYIFTFWCSLRLPLPLVGPMMPSFKRLFPIAGGFVSGKSPTASTILCRQTPKQQKLGKHVKQNQPKRGLKCFGEKKNEAFNDIQAAFCMIYIIATRWLMSCRFLFTQKVTWFFSWVQINHFHFA